MVCQELFHVLQLIQVCLSDIDCLISYSHGYLRIPRPKTIFFFGSFIIDNSLTFTLSDAFMLICYGFSMPSIAYFHHGLERCLTAVKHHVIRYCEKVYERSGKNLFWSIKNSGEALNKLKSRGVHATSLSTYDFSTLYTTLPHNLIKEKNMNLIEWTFKREGSPYIVCNERQAFFTSEDTKRYKLWSCQNVCESLIYLLDNIYIRFGTKLYRQIVGIPMGTNCAPLVADLFLFCYERDFMTSLSDVKQAEIIEPFKSTSRYLDDLLNIESKKTSNDQEPTQSDPISLLTILTLKAWSIVFIHLNCS